MSRFACGVVSVLFAACGVPALAADGNLVINGDFDGGIAFWTSSTASWSSGEDADGCTLSGALALAASGVSDGLATECIEAIVPAGTYRESLRVRFADTYTDSQPSVTMSVEEFPASTHCSGAGTSYETTDILSFTTGWQAASFAFGVPVDAGSIEVSISLTEAGASRTNDIAYVDLVRVEQNLDVFADGFEIGESCRWNPPPTCTGCG